MFDIGKDECLVCKSLLVGIAILYTQAKSIRRNFQVDPMTKASHPLFLCAC